MMPKTEYAVTRGSHRLVHLRFERARRVICGYPVDRTVATLGGRTLCPACVRFVS